MCVPAFIAKAELKKLADNVAVAVAAAKATAVAASLAGADPAAVKSAQQASATAEGAAKVGIPTVFTENTLPSIYRTTRLNESSLLHTANACFILDPQLCNRLIFICTVECRSPAICPLPSGTLIHCLSYSLPFIIGQSAPGNCQYPLCSLKLPFCFSPSFAGNGQQKIRLSDKWKSGVTVCSSESLPRLLGGCGRDSSSYRIL